jgi:hypothetical protein
VVNTFIDMKKEFVTYELALKLKELGFDEPCLAYYEGVELTHGMLNDIGKKRYLQTPLFQQAFRWFREKYELFHSTNYQDDNSGPGSFDYEILDKRGKHQQDDDAPEFDTYEEADLACLIKLIEIVETKR